MQNALDRLGVDAYEFSERAAIKEYDGNMPRQTAELQTFRELTGKEYENNRYS